MGSFLMFFSSSITYSLSQCTVRTPFGRHGSRNPTIHWAVPEESDVELITVPDQGGGGATWQGQSRRRPLWDGNVSHRKLYASSTLPSSGSAHPLPVSLYDGTVSVVYDLQPAPTFLVHLTETSTFTPVASLATSTTRSHSARAARSLGV